VRAEPEPDTSPLLRALQAHFANRPFSIEEAERFTLLSTPYLPKAHLKQRTLAPAERNGRLEALSARTKQFSFPARTLIRFL
jgi:hypothetical protein